MFAKISSIFKPKNVIVPEKDTSPSNESSQCSICLDKIKKNNHCTLKCDHSFHFECIMELYRTRNQFSNKCPLCRDEFTKKIEIPIHRQPRHGINIVIQTPPNVNGLNAPRNNGYQHPLDFLVEALTERLQGLDSVDEVVEEEELSVRSI